MRKHHFIYAENAFIPICLNNILKSDFYIVDLLKIKQVTSQNMWTKTNIWQGCHEDKTAIKDINMKE